MDEVTVCVVPAGSDVPEEGVDTAVVVSEEEVPDVDVSEVVVSAPEEGAVPPPPPPPPPQQTRDTDTISVNRIAPRESFVSILFRFFILFSLLNFLK